MVHRLGLRQVGGWEEEGTKERGREGGGREVDYERERDRDRERQRQREENERETETERDRDREREIAQIFAQREIAQRKRERESLHCTRCEIISLIVHRSLGRFSGWAGSIPAPPGRPGPAIPARPDRVDLARPGLNHHPHNRPGAGPARMRPGPAQPT